MTCQVFRIRATDARIVYDGIRCTTYAPAGEVILESWIMAPGHAERMCDQDHWEDVTGHRCFRNLDGCLIDYDPARGQYFPLNDDGTRQPTLYNISGLALQELIDTGVWDEQFPPWIMGPYPSAGLSDVPATSLGEVW